MRKKVSATVCAIIILVTLSACGSHNDDGMFVTDYSNLEGEITILVQGFADLRRFYAELFMHYHPNVVINIESMGHITDIAGQTALMTRLLADPPDIFIGVGHDRISEKTNLDALFFDLNPFLDGPRGINREYYFDNILRALENNGMLHTMPVYVRIESAMLNKRLFEGIGVDAAQITSLNFDREVDYFLRILEAFPDEQIFLNDYFSIDIFFTFPPRPLYDLATGQVFINSPEMYERLNRVLQIPVNPDHVTFTPDGVRAYELVGEMASGVLRQSRSMLFNYSAIPIRDLTTFFLNGHPDLQFTHPVVRADESDAGFRFQGIHSAHLLRNAPNTALAWEFLRFVMEQTRHPAHHEHFAALQRVDLPLLTANRARLENDLYPHIRSNHDGVWRSANMANHTTLTQEEHADLTVSATMSFFRDAMESLDNAVTATDFHVHQSIIAPEIWLLYSGQQTLAEMLERIHNRLEIYVNE